MVHVDSTATSYKMYTTLVECVQQIHKIVDVHGASAFFIELNGRQNLIHYRFHVEIGLDGLRNRKKSCVRKS